MNNDAAFSVSHFCAAWRVICAPCPDPTFVSGGGIEYLYSGLPIAFFNVGVVTDDSVSRGALEAYTRAARRFAAGRSVPWLLIVTHEALAADVDAEAVLDSCGFTPIIPLTGMRTERLAPAARTASGLEIGIADDDAACADAIDVNAAAYGMDLDACKPSLGRAFWQNHVLALGRAGGKPAASTAVLDVEGYRYVALVATTPEQQRRGYAEAVMRHALDLAAVRGDRPTTLHATEAGRPIYQRMGYEVIATHTAFIDRKFLDGH